ncbi:hypothetical protein TL16_g10573 [Triparma laevis f. inornata]|uniref:C-CAP/cofactor C-like domain-containing protein n=2 Tax=Triparma laevis TaxID=1534972 RepID=A0A9W7A361_9STRA|nr:hypothetical protein TrLO_g6373 [Triparma laevis f. longispina]GMH86517.1 hypothetical protein TL16_g10573 [Triparma laevis f. inornata]
MSSSTAPLGETLDSILARLSALESGAGIKPPAAPAASSTSSTSSGGGDAAFVKGYDDYVAKVMPKFTAACAALDGKLGEAGKAIEDAWSAQRAFLVAASSSKKPSDPAALQPFFKPYMDLKSTIKSNRDDWENHLKALGEMFGLLQWIMITPKPKDYLVDMCGAVDFWTNKIRVQYKKTEPKQVEWCEAVKGINLGLVEYVKGFHLAGVAYKMNGGGELSAAASAAPAAPKPAAAQKPKIGGGGGGGLLAELSKKSTGDSAATGLKKVTKDQQTWRKEFSGSDGAPAVKKSAFVKKKVDLGPPVFEFKDQGMKWIVENQTADTNPNGVLIVEVTDPKQQVYIYKCEGATIDIKGKCKGIVVDSCTKCNVLCDTIISCLETVNGKRMKLQVRGVCPSVAIDKTDGCLTYLSKETASITTFVTSKSSEMNVSWPDANDEYKEKAIPEQFQHKLNVESGSISSDISDLYSH